MSTIDEAWDAYERSAYPERDRDLRRDRRATVLRDCSNAACSARVAIGIPHCCDPCRHAHLVTGNGSGLRIEAHEHSAACVQRQIERGVRL